MIINDVGTCSIIFGDAESFPYNHNDPNFLNLLDKIREQYSLKNIIFNKQVHGNQGQFIITHQDKSIIYFEREGDWLMTNVSEVGIGILTADCLPIVFYEQKNKLIAVAHAGWRGSVLKITSIVLNEFKKITNLNPQIFFGPAAQSCCYEVQDDFIKQNNFEKSNVIINRDNQFFFDNVLFNKLQLIEMGVPENFINTSFSQCTICNDQYHSFRRALNKKLYKTQATIVWINK